MRTRLALAAAGLLLVAADLGAQRIGRGQARPRPDRPAEKPPLMPGIHDPTAYTRYSLSRFSIEQSPMISFLQTNGLLGEGIQQDYWTFGDATQLSFRATPSLAMTTTLTSSALGGPFAVGTADLGMRLKPWTGLRVTPFVDARYSWAYTAGQGYSSTVVPIMIGYDLRNGGYTTGTGRGSIFGFGADTRLTTRVWMTAAVTHTQYRMNSKSVGTFSERAYTMDATRLTIGARYNHGSWLDAPR